MFTARYALSTYITQTRFVFEGLNITFNFKAAYALAMVSCFPAIIPMEVKNDQIMICLGLIHFVTNQLND